MNHYFLFIIYVYEAIFFILTKQCPCVVLFDWEIFSNPSAVQILMNGEMITVNSIVKYTGDPNYPCYHLCGGSTCSANYLYIKDRVLTRIKADDEIVNQWPGERKLDMVIATYTVGFCPNRAVRDTTTDPFENYSSYEPNRSGSGPWLESMIVPNVNNPQVCMRRKVKCNYFTSGNKVPTSYQMFSTNY